MKSLFFLLIAAIIFASCSPSREIADRKLNNMKNWKQDAAAKKIERQARKTGNIDTVKN